MARHLYLCPMRWSDMDANRHINNVAYLRYLEEARIHLFLGLGKASRSDAEGRVVARNEIDYKHQLHWRLEPLPIEQWVSKIGNASFTISAELVDTDEAGKRTVYARSVTIVASIDLTHGHPIRVPPELRQFLEGFLDDE